MDKVTEAGYETEEAAVTKWLEDEFDLTLEVVDQKVLAREWMIRFIDLYCDDVTITMAEVVECLNDFFTLNRIGRQMNMMFPATKRKFRQPEQKPSLSRRATESSIRFFWHFRMR